MNVIWIRVIMIMINNNECDLDPCNNNNNDQQQ